MGIIKKLDQFTAMQLFNLLKKKNRMFDQNFFSLQIKHSPDPGLTVHP